MKEKTINKFTFKEICGILGKRNDEYAKLFHHLFDFALLFCPALIIPAEIVSSMFEKDIVCSISEAKEKLKTCMEDVVTLIKENSPGDYYKKYDDLRLANFLLIFAAYFDTVRTLLPDKDYRISPDGEITLYITEDALKKYAETFSDSKTKTIELREVPIFPHELTFYTFHREELLKLYRILTDELDAFYRRMFDDEKISSSTADVLDAKMRAAPMMALDAYEAQYISLKEKFSLFSAYTDTGEHKVIADKIDQLSQRMEAIEKNSSAKHALDVLQAEERYYQSRICNRVLYDGDNDEYEMLPVIKDSFIPQSYKSIVFRSDGKIRTVLGPDETWVGKEEKDDLIAYIHQTVSTPPFDRKPLIILGEPGGGKSTLCKMLAADVFSRQYHVIVVRLREVNANDDIASQIEQQIKRDISEDIQWSDIRSCVVETKVPLMIIFDGYDELLRAGGKDYTDYIKMVYQFQKDQEKVFEFFVRAIVTSRKNLIDLAELPNNSAVICLQEFSENKVNDWVDGWNQYNAERFRKRGVKPFEIRPHYADLTKQPLLLTMLALYDYDANALAEDKEMNSADVYRNLLENYVNLELQHKKPLGSVWGINGSEIMQAYLRVVSMGMLNRRQLYLTKEQFEKDLRFYGYKRPDEKPNESDDGIKLFGSFFFVNTSKVKEISGADGVDKFTYEFLHTTFGEYLAADHILRNYNQVLSELIRDGEISQKTMYDFYACTAFVCLSEKPNLLYMIGEIHERIISEKATDFLTRELKDVISGKMVLKQSEWQDFSEIPYESSTLVRYSALYALNLISISAFSGQWCDLAISKEEWGTLIGFLRMGLHVEELEAFSYHHFIDRFRECYHVSYQKLTPGMLSMMSKSPKVERLHFLSHILRDEINLAFSGTIVADRFVEPHIVEYGLELKSELYYLMMVKDMYPSNDEMGTLLKAQEACFEEGNFSILNALYTLAEKKYASNVNVKKQLCDFWMEGMQRFSSIPGKRFFEDTRDNYITKAFLELLHFTRLVRINYDMYKLAKLIMERLPIRSNEERFSIIGFIADAVPIIPEKQRSMEVSLALSGINSYIRESKRVGSIAAGFYIESTGKMFDGFAVSGSGFLEGIGINTADRVMGDILIKCKSLEQLSGNAKQIILTYLTQLYYRNNNSFEWLIQNLSSNYSFILLLEEWLCALQDCSEHTILVIWEALALLKPGYAGVDYHLFSQAVKACGAINTLDEKISDAIHRASRHVPEYDGSKNPLTMCAT